MIPSESILWPIRTRCKNHLFSLVVRYHVTSRLDDAPDGLLQPVFAILKSNHMQPSVQQLQSAVIRLSRQDDTVCNFPAIQIETK
jgi:hypothetical protein